MIVTCCFIHFTGWFERHKKRLILSIFKGLSGEINRVVYQENKHMKHITFITAVCLTVMFNAAYAADVADGAKEVKDYCNEQVDRSGIEDANEKNQFIQECLEGFAVSAAEDSSKAESN